MHEEQVHPRHETHEVNYSKADWLLFLVSFAAMLAFLVWDDRFFWLALPFAITFLVKALKMM